MTSITKRMYPKCRLIELKTLDSLDDPSLVNGDHYQLCSWNSINYIVIGENGSFTLDETIGEPLDLETTYALIRPEVQEPHIHSQMTSRIMTRAEILDIQKTF